MSRKILLTFAIISFSLIFTAQSASASITERALKLTLEGKEFVIPLSAYDFERTISITVDEIFLKQIVSKFATDSFVFYNQVSQHTVRDASIKIEPKVARLLEVRFIATEMQVTKPSAMEKFQEEPVSVALKIGKQTAVLALKNVGDTPVYAVKIKAKGGDIKFVKARAWYVHKLDPSTVIAQTDHRPLTKGHNMVVLAKLDEKYSGLEWILFDSANNIVWSGTVMSK